MSEKCTMTMKSLPEQKKRLRNDAIIWDMEQSDLIDLMLKALERRIVDVKKHFHINPYRGFLDGIIANCILLRDTGEMSEKAFIREMKNLAEDSQDTEWK